MIHKMHFAQILLCVVAALLVIPNGTDALAPPSLQKLQKFPSIGIRQAYNRNRILKSSAASSIEMPAAALAQESTRGLNRLQSKIVQALMIIYIASMCVALPV